jgi:hypothetical protein
MLLDEVWLKTSSACNFCFKCPFQEFKIILEISN